MEKPNIISDLINLNLELFYLSKEEKMANSAFDLNGCEPDFKECRTEMIVDDFSQCLSPRAKCLYCYPAGTVNYCLHHNNRQFEN
jgi:hypothetical protein